MRVKTFKGSNNKAVLDQIKAELGLDAVIIESRTHTEDGQKVVTMTAALEKIGEEMVPPSSGRDKGSAGRREWPEEWGDIKSHLLALMKPALRLDQLGPRHRTAIEYLEKDGANDQVLLELYRRLAGKPDAPVLEPMTAMLPLKPWGYEQWPQRLHLVAGPYGSGKTTTAVRMALALQKSGKTRGGGRICIVNADAERGNGRLLLRHYTGLSNLIYREASGGMEMSAVIAEVGRQGFERVIVDLPGLSKGARLYDLADELGLSCLEPIQMALHLVLSPQYDDDFVLNLLERYRLEIPGSIVWSKLDEAGRYGAIINASLTSRLPISCLSFGPGLLNTLVPAKPAALWKLLFKHELPATNADAAGIGDNYE